MQGGNKVSTRVFIVVLAAVAVGAGIAVFRLLASRHAQPAANLPMNGHTFPSLARTCSGVRTPLDAAAEIAQLERSMRDLDARHSDLFRKLADTRRKAGASSAAWAAELEQARREVEAAIDAHPRVVAARNEMQQILEKQHVIDTNSAAILTVLHKKRDDRVASFHNADKAIWDRAREERAAFMREIGKTDMRKLTPEETDRLAKIDAKNVAEAHELAAKHTERQKVLDDDEQRLTSEYDALRKQIDTMSDRYAQLYNDMPGVRASVRAEDPAIAALDQNLTAMAARRQAVLNAGPETEALVRKIGEIDKQRTEVAARLRLLRIASADAPSNGAAKADGKNG
jgi:chromosome segregation ATPase